MTTVLRPATLPVRNAAPVISFDRARELAAEFGTPTLAVSRSKLQSVYREMKSSLPDVDLFYAAKANSDVSILRTLFLEGSFVDVCSYREMQSALLAGFSPEQMIHTHPCKTADNTKSCYQEGLRWFTFDCEAEIDKIRRNAPDTKALLRLRADSQSSLINLSAKFGCAVSEAPALARAAIRRGLDVRALSFHVGSQCTNPEDFRSMLIRTREVWDECVAAGCQLEMLDVGGGFPAPYRTSVLPLGDYCRHLARALDATFGDLDIRIIAEPGRGLCAESVTLVTRVLGKSVRNGLPWYFIDDGVYGSFSGKLFDHADFGIVAEAADMRPRSACVLAGPTCDSHDVVAVDQELPDLEIGELLLVPTMGAYSSASASGFNGLDIARLVEVD
ncbi:MAG: type III PLP-dependent enzyme [Planctomycetota bacterium]|nr:type III PLP-dependent enzyme [Planctomycetota bacterium]MDA1252243.1 type III PLP-dependent enzyme [Planctomycetota bacterium]